MERDAFACCHPVVTFSYFAAAIVLCAVVRHPAYLLASLAAGALYYLVLRGKRAAGFLVALVPLFLAVVAINPLFNTRGEHVLFELFGRPYTLEALAYGAVVAGVLVGMLVWFACYSQVMTSDKFTCLFGNLAPALSLLVVMVLRMVPGLMRKAEDILVARRCVGRGVSEATGARAKVRGGVDVLSGLVDHALEGSVVTADSMRARGYGMGRRTSFRLWRLEVRDVVLLVVGAALLVCTALAGGMGARFVPRIVVDPLSWGFAAYCAFLLLPLAVRAKEAVQWRISLRSI